MGSLHPLVEICFRSAAVYLAMLVGLRLAGKRHVGQVSPHDMVMLLLIANAVQNAMVGSHPYHQTSLEGGLTAMGTLILLNSLVSRFLLRSERFSRFLAGQPTLLIRNGRVIDEHLAHEGIRREELEAKIREHGFEGPGQVKSAIQECDGSISVIAFNSQHEQRLAPLHRHRHREHRRRRP